MHMCSTLLAVLLVLGRVSAQDWICEVASPLTAECPADAATPVQFSAGESIVFQYDRESAGPTTTSYTLSFSGASPQFWSVTPSTFSLDKTEGATNRVMITVQFDEAGTATVGGHAANLLSNGGTDGSWAFSGTVAAPTGTPTTAPTGTPTTAPTGTPTGAPTGTPTGAPTGTPTGAPTDSPTPAPGTPTVSPTGTPTGAPTGSPTVAGTGSPTTISPTTAPTMSPTDGCAPGTWGVVPSCSNSCPCSNNTVSGTCNLGDGTCTTCKANYLEPGCLECADGYFGSDCEQQCADCPYGGCTQAFHTCAIDTVLYVSSCGGFNVFQSLALVNEVCPGTTSTSYAFVAPSGTCGLPGSLPVWYCSGDGSFHLEQATCAGTASSYPMMTQISVPAVLGGFNANCTTLTPTQVPTGAPTTLAPTSFPTPPTTLSPTPPSFAPTRVPTPPTPPPTPFPSPFVTTLTGAAVRGSGSSLAVVVVIGVLVGLL